MYIFEKEQMIFEIGGIKIGGQPGETPTVLAGTIFYEGQKKIHKDSKEGTFDWQIAENLIHTQNEFSDETGIPCLIHVFGKTPQAIEKYIDFITEITDSPFLLDSTDPNTRIAGLKYATEIGISERVIYNSINISGTTQEFETIRDLNPDSAILLAFNPKDNSVQGKIDVLESGVAPLKKGLLEISNDCGIAHPLIDTAITPIGFGAGISVLFSFVAKSKYGFPVGSGVHNAPSAWSWLKKLKKSRPDGRQIAKVCDVSSNVIVQMCGSDFILYGPIENAPFVFPITAMVDCFIAESVSKELGISIPENHPLKRLV